MLKWCFNLLLFMFAIVISPAGYAQGTKPLLYLNATQTIGFMEDSKTRPGIFIEITQKIGELAGIDIRTKFYPWPRSMKNVQDKSDNIIIGLSHTPARKDKFTWITPIMDLNISFVTLNESIDSYAEGLKMGSVGLWKGSSYHNELKAKGFQNIRGFSTNTDTDRAITLLENRRLDTWYGDNNEFKIRWQHFARQKNRPLVFGKALYVDTVWMAGGLKFSPEQAAKLKAAFKEIKSNGDYQKIERKYFGNQ